MTAIREINILKDALIKLKKEEPNVFNSLIKDVVQENERDIELELLMQRAFERFGDTFRALA